MNAGAMRALLLPIVVAGLALTARSALTFRDQPLPRLRVEGTQFLDETGRAYIPRWVSGLTLLARSPYQQATYLDWAARTGFNGVRVFAGALAWAGQSPESARAALPGLLDRAAARGLAVEVTALTDTGTGYDARAHLSVIVDILAGRPGVVLELANEVGHPTQARDMTPSRLQAWGRELAAPRGVVWAIGAVDDPALAGDYSTIHVNRANGLWEQVPGLKVLHTTAIRLGVPVINNEPIGADEQHGRHTGRQRIDEPAVFLVFGASDQASGFGGVHHSQAGLLAALPGPVQQRSAEAYVAGHRAVESVLGDERGVLRDVGEGGAPLVSVSGLPADRVLTFVAGKQAVIVVAGAHDDTVLRWAEGWTPQRVVKTMRGADGRRVDIIHARIK